MQEEKKAELFALAEKKAFRFPCDRGVSAAFGKKDSKGDCFCAGRSFAHLYRSRRWQGFLQELERECGCELLVSGYPFGGGMRAVIPSKNVLIDESFDSRLSEEKENFSF